MNEFLYHIFVLVVSIAVVVLNVRGLRSGKREFKFEEAPEPSRDWVRRNEDRLNKIFRYSAIAIGAVGIASSLLLLIVF